MPINSIHTLITIVAGTLIAIMAVCLLAVGMPRDKRLKNYRTSRRVLAVGYFMLSAACFLALWVGLSHTAETDPMVKTVVLITASLQGMMYEYTVLTLINPMFPTIRRIISSLIPIVIGGIVLGASFAWGGVAVFQWAFYAAWCLYMLQLVVYLRMFRREYSNYKDALNNYFSDDRGRHLKWIRTAYYLAVGLGIAAGLSLFLLSVSFAVFMALLTIFYVYYAVRYIGYARHFAAMAPAFEPLFEEVGDQSAETEKLVASVNEWIARKRFVQTGVTLEQAAAELGVNRTLLAIYIDRKGRTFRRWITELRMEEAREIIISDPRLPLSQVCDAVGVKRLRLFYNSFSRVTGEDARDFRDRMLAVKQNTVKK